MIEEDKYLEIRDKLKSLPKIKASDDFVQKLQHKITVLEIENKQQHFNKVDNNKLNFLKNLFSRGQNPWLVPAVGFTIIVLFVFYILMGKNTPQNNEEQLSTNKIEQPGDNNTTQQNSITNNPAPGIQENKTQKEKSTNKDIASDLNNKSREEIRAPVETEKPSTDRANIKKKYEENESIQTESIQTTESNENVVVKDKPELQKKSDLQETERMSVVTPQNKLTGPKKEGETLKAVAVKDSGFPESKQHLLDQINSLDKSSLEKLREKVTDN